MAICKILKIFRKSSSFLGIALSGQDLYKSEITCHCISLSIKADDILYTFSSLLTTVSTPFTVRKSVFFFCLESLTCIIELKNPANENQKKSIADPNISILTSQSEAW